MPTLTVQNAELRTATVAIKTLTVSGKQVTLAVFRQLPEQPLLAEDSTLNGVPWGWVNYHPDPKACPEEPHRHIVWQHGTELRRATVTLAPPQEPMFRPRSGTAYLDAYVRNVLAGSGGSLPPANDDDEVVVRIGDLMVEMKLSEQARHALDLWKVYRSALAEFVEGGETARYNFRMDGVKWWRPEYRISVSAAVRAYRHLLDEEAARLGTQSLADAHARVEAEVAVESADRRRVREVRRALTDLPQLFIAI